MNNQLTLDEAVHIETMNRLAVWYAGHVIGSDVHHVTSLAEEADESYDGRIISLVWSVFDASSDLLGWVAWSIDAPGDGWEHGLSA